MTRCAAEDSRRPPCSLRVDSNVEKKVRSARFTYVDQTACMSVDGCRVQVLNRIQEEGTYKLCSLHANILFLVLPAFSSLHASFLHVIRGA